MKILALSGSLRAKSINSMLLRAAARLALAGIEVSVFQGLGELPLFNPDLEARPPATVTTFYKAVAEADALIIAGPEYAHGVSGTIKNALDWLVSFEPFAAKCVAVFNTSPRAYHAELALRETLKTMAAVIVEEASISIALLGANLDESAIVTDPAIASMIRRSLRALKHAVMCLRDPRVAQLLTTW